MELSKERFRHYTRRIMLSRMRVLLKNGFFGLLLMRVKLSLGDEFDTAWTDGTRIWFYPPFIDRLTDEELDYVLMHEVMHIVLYHCERLDTKKSYEYNVAADIIVNSNILKSNDMDIKSISLSQFGGEMMHLAPDGTEGYLHSLEELFIAVDKELNDKGKKEKNCGGKGGDYDTGWDEHSKLRGKPNPTETAKWKKNINDAAESAKTNKSAGNLPSFVERMLDELKNPKIDWRTILNDFVQEDVVDYSFLPPDRRYDGDFFLPDFNEKDEKVENVLFMIDTSGSMTREEITEAYSEIFGALQQFDGKLQGLLGYFDYVVTPPKRFSDTEELKNIPPIGGGGTSFSAIFDYVRKNMSDDLPVSIIILTDGYCSFPPEESALGIPVLWLINNDDVTPPWGRIARLVD